MKTNPPTAQKSPLNNYVHSNNRPKSGILAGIEPIDDTNEWMFIDTSKNK